MIYPSFKAQDSHLDPPDEVEDEHPEDEWYKCLCGVWVPYDEATIRMIEHGQCEDCDSNDYD